MKYMRTLACGLLLVSAAAKAQVDSSIETTIISVASFNSGWGNGDVSFQIANPTTACPGGYWMSKADVGYTNSLALMLMAHQSKVKVVIAGSADQIWAGSHTPYCKLYSISAK